MYCIFDAQRTILERDRQFFVCVCLFVCFFSEIELGNVDKRELWVPFLNNHENFYKNISINFSFRVVRLMTLSKEVARFEIGSNVNFRSCLRNNFFLEILKASKFCSALVSLFFFLWNHHDTSVVCVEMKGLLTLSPSFFVDMLKIVFGGYFFSLMSS